MSVKQKQWLLGWRHPSVGIFKVKRNYKKLALAITLMSVSFIIPDGSLGLVLGSCIASPIPFKKNIKNKLHDLKYFALTQYYKR